MTLSFRESIAAHTTTPAFLKLPFCHVASAKTILGFIEASKVSTQEVCDVFGEQLNYFFYGRAAYRPKELGATAVIDRPAALILKPAAIASPRTIYPFDTGGFPRYAKANGHSLQDFALMPDLGDCERVIERHWASYQQYLFADLNGFHHRIDPNCFAVESYSDIVRETESEIADHRRSSIEVTSLLDVPVNIDTIIGIVIPYVYAGRDSILYLQSVGINVKKVRYLHANRADDMAVVMEYACDIADHWHGSLQNG